MPEERLSRRLTVRFSGRTDQPGVAPVVLFALVGWLDGITGEPRLAEACRLYLACRSFPG